MEQPISLIPFSNEYVLIHKKALFINGFAASLMAQYLVQETKEFHNQTPEDVITVFAEIARKESSNLTPDQVSEVIQQNIDQARHANTTVVKTSFN